MISIIAFVMAFCFGFGLWWLGSRVMKTTELQMNERLTRLYEREDDNWVIIHSLTRIDQMLIDEGYVKLKQVIRNGGELSLTERGNAKARQVINPFGGIKA